MSQDNIEEKADVSCCALCGIAEIVDDIKLKDCDGCDLVLYCSDECREEHKPEHEEECKKRAAELRDELLFKQPEGTHWGDCPICSLPMPPDIKKSTIYDCCSKLICNGCNYANQNREIEMGLQQSCPFCCKNAPKTKSEQEKRRMKRVKANDPVANRREGTKQRSKGEYIKAFEYYTKAAELGDMEAHYSLAVMYRLGLGVEKDKGKEIIYHYEEAAIGGHPSARYNLGCEEMDNGNVERAVKHWIIAATQGLDESIKSLMGAFREGFISKERLAVALRAHHAVVDDMKSPQREAALNHNQM